MSVVTIDRGLSVNVAAGAGAATPIATAAVANIAPRARNFLGTSLSSGSDSACFLNAPNSYMGIGRSSSMGPEGRVPNRESIFIYEFRPTPIILSGRIASTLSRPSGQGEDETVTPATRSVTGDRLQPP